MVTSDRYAHRLIHGYVDIDYDLVWATIERDLPELERQVRAILGEAPKS